MKTEPDRSSEFDKFDRLVGQVLSVPKPEIERIKADEQKAKPAKDRAKGKNGRAAV